MGYIYMLIDKRNGKEEIYISKKNAEELARLELSPNYKVIEVQYSDIPK